MRSTQGLNYCNNAVMAQQPLYVFLFKANYTPLLTDTMSTFPTLAQELITEYDEATRPLFVYGASVNGVVDNIASPAVFTFNTPVRVYGAGLSTSNVKGDLTGFLVDAKLFTAYKDYVDTDVLNHNYELVMVNPA